MKQILFLSLLTFSAAAFAKDYQVTGNVLEISDSKITVDKKGEKFEIARTAATKPAASQVKVGDKVTVYYSMTATEIESKAAGAKAKKK